MTLFAVLGKTPRKDRKAVWGWALYDWANSAFATTVMAGFFPIFFKQYWSFGANVNLSTARLGLANSLASLLVALMAPILGAVADKGSVRKRMLVCFAYLGVLMTAALFWVPRGNWAMAVFIYVTGIVGFSGANIFYDALLPGLADTSLDDARIDRVSSFGFALGYLGGGLLFAVNVAMTLMPATFGLADASQAVRLSFLTVALWWGGFSVFTILWVPENPPASGSRSIAEAVFGGVRQLRETLGQVRHLKTVWLFLVAYWCYIDGVDTVIRMAVDYGISLGFASNDLIVALLIVQFVGFPSALLFGWLGERWGARRSIFVAIGVYLLVTLWGTQMQRPHEFYLLAVVIGLVQGGIQALSRSFYARLIPPGRWAEFFGFYNMLGKFAAILGPALMGAVGLLARHWLMPPDPTPQQVVLVGQTASRWSIGSIAILFLLGGVLLYFVDEKKGRRQLSMLKPRP